MKRVLICVLALLILFSVTGCKKKTGEEKNEPVINENDNKGDKKDDSDGKDKETQTVSSSENEIPLSELYALLDVDGTWKCPVQNFDFTVNFAVEGGKYVIRQSTDYSDHETYVINEAVKAYYDTKTGLYRIETKAEEGRAHIGDVLVSTDRVYEGYIKASNYYDDMKMVEYYLVKGENTETTTTSLQHTIWLLNDESLDFQYLPYLDLGKDGRFEICENLYEGFGYYRGSYVENEDSYALYVDEKENLKGFMGQDVDYIEFKKIDDVTLQLMTDLCYSRNGHYFDLIRREN